MGTNEKQSTVDEQANLTASPQAGKNDTGATAHADKKRDTAAILTTTIGMLQDAGWLVQIATMDGVAYLVVPGAKWVVTAAGWMLVEDGE